MASSTNSQNEAGKPGKQKAWLGFWNALQLPGVVRREAVRFIAVSQYQAGAFLHAVPSRRAFRISTWALRIPVQRRLGLPLDEAHARGAPTCTGAAGASPSLPCAPPCSFSAASSRAAAHAGRRHSAP